MALEVCNYYRDLKSLHDECERCMHYHTTFTLTDGSTFDGIIEKVEDDHVIVLVGEDVMEHECEHQMDQHRQPFTYGRPRRRFRRFRRHAFPFKTLAALALLRYPFFGPPYPYPFFPY